MTPSHLILYWALHLALDSSHESTIFLLLRVASQSLSNSPLLNIRPNISSFSNSYSHVNCYITHTYLHTLTGLYFLTFGDTPHLLSLLWTHFQSFLLLCICYLFLLNIHHGTCFTTFSLSTYPSHLS